VSVDIFIYEVRDALAAMECPLCRADRIDQHRWMETFAREGHRDPGARRSFVSAGGFCGSHARLFSAVAEERQARQVVASVYRSLVDDDLLRLGAIAGTARRPRRPKSWLRWRRSVCPACHAREEASERKLYFLCEALADPSFRREYERSGGLCASHTLAAIAKTGKRGELQRRFLVADWQRRLIKLQDSLIEFDRKRDHRYSTEPKGDEQRSPLEALHHFAGSADSSPSGGA